MSTIRRIETAAEIFEALGMARIMEVTHAKYTRAHQWKRSGTFPPNTYVVLKLALADISATAPDHLWRMIQADPAPFANVGRRVSSAHGDEVQP